MAPTPNYSAITSVVLPPDFGVVSDTPTTNDQPSSALMRLSPEIRNRIFTLVCEDTTMTWKKRSGSREEKSFADGPHHWNAWVAAEPYFKDHQECPMYTFVTTWKVDGRPIGPGFILACKQIYKENIKMLLASARLEFTTKIAFRGWLFGRSHDEVKNAEQVFLEGEHQSYDDMVRERRTKGPVQKYKVYFSPNLANLTLSNFSQDEGDGRYYVQWPAHGA